MDRQSRLKPVQSILLVCRNECTQLSPECISIELVGEKAFGLSAIYNTWTLPFFVVSAQMYEDYKKRNNNSLKSIWEHKLIEAFKEKNFDYDEEYYVRSSACCEGLDQRGKYTTLKSTGNMIFDTILRCFDGIDIYDANIKMPLIVQKAAQSLIKGHLSNERRISCEARDWKIEYENVYKTYPISIRNWRKKINVYEYSSKSLICLSEGLIKRTLTIPASWATYNKLRIHFEWVYDGDKIYIVQADEEKISVGISPLEIDALKVDKQIEFKPSCLHKITAQDAESLKDFSKVQNSLIYAQLGMSTAPLYILQDVNELDLLAQGKISPELRHDLEILVSRSLVIRTDIVSNQKHEKQMLPRTDREMRNLDEVIEWLQTKSSWIKAQFQCKYIFILHNFIPAFSSAFAYAEPHNRNVMIEALWGLPEGLYYYSHDKYVVDTATPTASKMDVSDFQIYPEKKFKKYFVYPTHDGEWEVQQLADPYDWKESIPCSDWVKEIAYQSRRIADKINKSISVMWFVGVDKELYNCDVFPWHHEEYAYADVKKHDNKLKSPFEKDYLITSMADLDTLKEESVKEDSYIRTISLQPTDINILRDKEMIMTVGNLAKSLSAVIVLEGGVLSHAYYQLTRTGAKVEAKDVFGKITPDTEHNKLVRDKIPQKIERNGEVAITTNKVDFDELLLLLRRKLVEESLEVLDAKSTEDILSELADVMEVFDSIRSRLKISKKAIYEAQAEKKEKVGGFEKGIVLLKTSNPLFTEEKLSDVENPIKNENIKKSTDSKKRSTSNEALTRIKVPLDMKDWSIRASTNGLINNTNLEVDLKGHRDGRILQIELSIFEKIQQLSLFED